VDFGVIRDFMSRDIATAGADDCVDVVARRMADHRLDRVFVVDGDGRLRGALSAVDLLRHYIASPQPTRTPRDGSR
jgi:CBS domain-containing protein